MAVVALIVLQPRQGLVALLHHELAGELPAQLELQAEVEKLYARVHDERDLVFEADGFG